MQEGLQEDVALPVDFCLNGAESVEEDDAAVLGGSEGRQTLSDLERRLGGTTIRLKQENGIDASWPDLGHICGQSLSRGLNTNVGPVLREVSQICHMYLG